MQESMENVTSQVGPRRPTLGRRVTCQYYSPALVLSRNDEKRLQVVLELLQTEERYLTCLRTLKSVFEDNLYSTLIIPIKDIETIFPVELNDIRDIHECLYNALKKRVLQWNDRSTVGDMFVDFVSDNNQFHVLGLYSSFSNNFPKAIRTINRCIKNCGGFKDFLQTPSTSLTCKGLDLQALLLNPIQRLPRYLLLFKQLIKFTDVNHPDRVHVEQALVTLSNTVTILNNSIQSSLKVANGLTARKRATRRPLNCQRDSIKVFHRVSEQHVLNLPQDAKVKIEESSSSCATTPQSVRPASVCSSVSSGYASDEGDSSPLNTCTNNESKYCERNAEFTRLVQELRQQSALEQLAQQKFDFSVSCISPTLQRLHILRLQDVKQKEEDDKKEYPLTPRRKCAVALRDGETMDFTPRGKGMSSLEDKENNIDLNNNNTTQQTDQLKTCCSSTNVDQDTQRTNGLSNVPLLNIRPRVHRSYSEGVPLSLVQIRDFASCDLQKDQELATPEVTPSSITSNKISTFQRFSKDRRSWAPGNSFSTQYSDNAFCRWGNRSSFRRSFVGDMFEEDSLSVVSDLSTMSGESSVSGMSTASEPVHGRHASKKRYHKLRDLFRQFRSKQRGSSYQNTMPTIPQNDVINIKRPLVIPRMMISTV
ncbi:uncharacterized protein LOC116306293 [Actinia tenebrosa]|uniref:Uncharacterized protein LOC116306293 n=1 Tax=Actinia tenebrosa TaxID=6105 RepID=A0A6P8J253_ACTTE|nr:uncharacterized protein LOC116306293 [Actinia tenebrosa]